MYTLPPTLLLAYHGLVIVLPVFQISKAHDRLFKTRCDVLPEQRHLSGFPLAASSESTACFGASSGEWPCRPWAPVSWASWSERRAPHFFLVVLKSVLRDFESNGLGRDLDPLEFQGFYICRFLQGFTAVSTSPKQKWTISWASWLSCLLDLRPLHNLPNPIN